IYDDFFDLGGQSLAMSHLVGRIEAELGVRVTVRSLYEAPTIAEMSALVRGQLAIRQDTVAPVERLVPRLTARSPGHDLPATMVQLDWLDTHREHPEFCYAARTSLLLVGALDVEIFARSLEALAERHEILRTGIVEDNGRFVQNVDRRISVDLETV